MDTTNILLMALQAITSAFCVILWSILNNIRTKADKTADELSSYKLYAAEKFLTKVELRDAMDTLNKSFEQHATRIDNRLDKLEERILKMTESRNND